MRRSTGRKIPYSRDDPENRNTQYSELQTQQESSNRGIKGPPKNYGCRGGGGGKGRTNMQKSMGGGEKGGGGNSLKTPLLQKKKSS